MPTAPMALRSSTCRRHQSPPPMCSTIRLCPSTTIRMYVQHVLTDNGREFCGRELQHPFEIFLAINHIKHRRTEVRSPETNGFCERFHRTIKEEFFVTAFRKKIY